MAQQRRPGADSRDGLVGQLRGEPGGVLGHVGGAVDLHHALVGDAAPFRLGQREELVGVLEERVTELVEAAGAAVGPHCRPRAVVERAACGGDSVADLADARIGRGADRRLGGRGDVFVAADLRIDPAAVDIEPIGVDKGPRTL